MTPVTFDFGRVIGPVGLSDFLAEYYEASPLILQRDDPLYYADLLTVEQVWSHIETRCPPLTQVNLIKLGAGVPENGWYGPNGRADPSRLAELYDDGWTIGLTKMHDQLPALGLLCAAAESVFSCPFQTNLYLTPPGAQGFRPHWDTHDVFVLQVHGSKEWTLYDTQIALPLVGQSFNQDKPEPGPPSRTFRLSAGDLLYCPRGLMHSAASSMDASLHITFGLMGQTWSEFLVEAVAELSLRNPDLRRNLPVGFANPGFDPAKAALAFAGLLSTVAQQADFQAVFAQSRDRFVSTRTRRLPGLAAQRESAGRLGADSVVQARPSLIVAYEADDEVVSVTCGSAVVSLPAFTEGALRVALSGRAFRVADLPGPLDEDGKVTLARRLIREGLAQPAG